MMYEANAGTPIDIVKPNGKVDEIKFTEKALLEHAEYMKTLLKSIEFDLKHIDIISRNW